MEFDVFTVTVFESVPDAPTIPESEENAIQDAHMAYLTMLHDTGVLGAAGPFVTPPGRVFRGMCIHQRPEAEVRERMAQDPAVRARRLGYLCFTWWVPKGAVSFGPAQFPRSQSEL